MEYFIYETDNNGVTYSIDNLVLEYIFNHPNINYLEFLHELKTKYKDIENEYYEDLDKPYCSKWQFYNNRVHLCNGVTTWFGKWTLSNEGEKYIFPIIRVEFNPNKHGHKSIVKDLFDYIIDNSGDSELKRYDFSIDIRCKPEDIIIDTRKEKGLHKGTRYFGQRNHDGYCKVYNKKVEQNLDYDLTRVEYTIVHNKKGKNKKQGLNIDKIYLRYDKNELVNLSKPMYALYRFCCLCDISNLDYDDILSGLNYKEQRKIKSALYNGSFEEFIISRDIHDRLIDSVYKMYGLNYVHKPIEEIDGYLSCEDIDIPFD